VDRANDELINQEIAGQFVGEMCDDNSRVAANREKQHEGKTVVPAYQHGPFLLGETEDLFIRLPAHAEVPDVENHETYRGTHRGGRSGHACVNDDGQHLTNHPDFFLGNLFRRLDTPGWKCLPLVANLRYS
jgi:hypothetical protein